MVSKRKMSEKQTDTPMTDAATDFTAPEKLRECSRKLERKLATANAKIKTLKRQVADLKHCKDAIAAWSRAEAERVITNERGGDGRL